MSAPKTNIEKQKRRHIGPLVGIALALLVAGALLFWLLGNVLVDTETSTEVPIAPADVPETAIDPVSPDESPAVEPLQPTPDD